MTLTLVSLVLLLFTAAVKASPPHRHSQDPMSDAARRWRPDREWLRAAFCIHRHESVDWHLAGRDWAGNSSSYYGGMQFLESTWRNAGGPGLPLGLHGRMRYWASDWAPREQLYRAWRVWSVDGGSWREWGTAGACGLS